VRTAASSSRACLTFSGQDIHIAPLLAFIKPSMCRQVLFKSCELWLNSLDVCDKLHPASIIIDDNKDKNNSEFTRILNNSLEHICNTKVGKYLEAGSEIIQNLPLLFRN
jgi:hypothetical protein